MLPCRAPNRSIDECCSIAALPSSHSNAACHPDTATIAKRRAQAFTLSCPTPPVENVGLHKGLSGLDGRATASQGLREELQHGVVIVSSIVAAAGQSDLDEDAEDSPEGNSETKHVLPAMQDVRGSHAHNCVTPCSVVEKVSADCWPPMRCGKCCLSALFDDSMAMLGRECAPE